MSSESGFKEALMNQNQNLKKWFSITLAVFSKTVLNYTGLMGYTGSWYNINKTIDYESDLKNIFQEISATLKVYTEKKGELRSSIFKMYHDCLLKMQ